MSDARQAIYEQDCAFMRHHDGNKWSRFQTVAAIEGASLYGAFEVDNLEKYARMGLVLLATLLVLHVFLLFLRDEKSITAHRTRIRDYESETPFDRSGTEGRKITRYVFATIFVFNVVAMAHLFDRTEPKLALDPTVFRAP